LLKTGTDGNGTGVTGKHHHRSSDEAGSEGKRRASGGRRPLKGAPLRKKKKTLKTKHPGRRKKCLVGTPGYNRYFRSPFYQETDEPPRGPEEAGKNYRAESCSVVVKGKKGALTSGVTEDSWGAGDRCF